MSEINPLPTGWAKARVKEITTKVGSGATPRGGKGAYQTSGTPLIRSQNVRFGGFLEDGLAYLNESQAKELDGAIVKPSNVLLNITGASIGRVTVAPASMDDAHVSQHVCIIRPVAGIDASYLRWFIASPAQQRRISEVQVGVTRQALTKEMVLQFEVPLATSDEQVRIAAKLDELFSDLDVGVAALERARANVKRYRVAVLKAAVEGRLTERWRAENSPGETGEELLDRILMERRRRWEKKQLASYAAKGQTPPKNWQMKYPEPSSPRTSPLPEMPGGWSSATIDQVSVSIRYGSSAKTSSGPEGVPVLRMGNIREGELDFANLKYLPIDHPEFPDLFLEPGDLLFNRTNSAELVGKTAVFRGLGGPCSYASYLIAVRCLPGINPHFLSIFLNSHFGRLWIASVVSQQVGQANVNGTKLQSLCVPLPPSDEQDQIVREVESLVGGITLAEREIARSVMRANRLRQGVLERAFEGRLVPQDPSDEPAEALLERLRHERAGSNGSTGTSSRTGRPRKSRKAKPDSVEKP